MFKKMALVVFITILALLFWFEADMGLRLRAHQGYPPVLAVSNLDSIQTGFSKTGLDPLKSEFHSRDHRVLLRQVADSVSKVEPQPSKNPLKIYQEAQHGKGALCDGMAMLYFSVLRLNGIKARIIYLTRNIYDIYDTHTTVEVFCNGKWAIFDPTFHISFERNGILLSAREIQEALLGGDFYTIKPIFYGEVKYPARIQKYYSHWLPLFNNVFVVGNRKGSFWEQLPPFRYWYGGAYYYQRTAPYSDYHLQFYNSLIFLLWVIVPVALYGVIFGIVGYTMRWLFMPPKIIVKKGLKKIYRELKSCGKRLVDQYQPAYALNFPASMSQPAVYFGGFSVGPGDLKPDELLAVADYYRRHYFDLLGSGWVQVKHNMDCPGLEGNRYHMGIPLSSDGAGRWLKGRISPINLPESMRIWQLINEDYIPLDWQLDFKSGYRWSEPVYYLDIRYGHRPGVDIKVPWELARMQHLPQLALACHVAAKVKPAGDSSDIYPREFRNQVLDFIATNPPGFGVNWRCSMDVGIRVANWLVAYDIFKSGGAVFDSPFEQIFVRSIYEHGRHIINNLEWSAEFRSNHYLADIVGLLFAAAYLPESAETNCWLYFAVKELIAEVKLQFGEDGGNFEASTSYHRLSAEMVIYATALILGISDDRLRQPVDIDYFQKRKILCQPGPVSYYPLPGNRCSPFPLWYMERLEKMAEFTMHVTKPDGHIPQIGDNDSGRFLKLQTVYRPMTVSDAVNAYTNLKGYTALTGAQVYWSEDILDHRHLIAAINGLYNRPDFAGFAGKETLETGVIRRLSRNTCFPSYIEPDKDTAAERILGGSEQSLREIMAGWDLPAVYCSTRTIPLPADGLVGGLKTYVYPDFGLYVYRSKRLYLAVRCGSTGQNGHGGHAHNDQLSIELNIDGSDLISDPGTYLYTPLPERRNLYRSVKSHETPWADNREPGRLDLGLFIMGEAEGGQAIWFGSNGFLGRYKDIQLFMMIEPNQIILKAKSNRWKVEWSHGPSLPFSDGYGRLRG